MGSVFKRKLYDQWRCEITSVSSPDESSVEQTPTTAQEPSQLNIRQDNSEKLTSEYPPTDEEAEDCMDGDTSFPHFDDSDMPAGDLEKSVEVTNDTYQRHTSHEIEADYCSLESEGDVLHPPDSTRTAAESETLPNIPVQNGEQHAAEVVGGTMVHAEVPDLCSNDVKEEPTAEPTTGRTESEPSGSKSKQSKPEEPPKEHECPQCGKFFPFMCRLLQHVNVHYGVKRVKNTNSKDGTEKSSGTEATEESVDTTIQKPAVSSKPVKISCCERCGKTFTDPNVFKNHMLRHKYIKKTNICRGGEKKKHLCTTCGKEYQCQSQLIEHSRTHTGEKPFVCSVCDRGFSTKQACMVHMAIHTGERPFVCSFCGKGFILNHVLVAHTRTHTGERPFPCDVCGKTFSHKGRLREHKYAHSTENKFGCSYCGESFKRRAVRDNHVMKHTGKVRHTCSLCGKGFRHTTSFQQHQRTHTGEKPYSCSICDKSFNNRSHVARHERIHTGEKPFQCQLCGESFAQTECLKRHMSKHTIC